MDGRRLRDARKALRISTNDLGARLGVSGATISRWESDIHEPDDETKLRLSRELGVTMDYLMGTPNGGTPAPRFKATEDLDRIVRDLSHVDPDIGLLFRTTVKNWDQVPDRTKEKIAEIFRVGLGLADLDDVGERVRSDEDL